MEQILHEQVSSYQAIGGTEVFFAKRSDFPGKRQKLDSFVFTMLPKHVEIKSLSEFVSAWPSG